MNVYRAAGEFWPLSGTKKGVVQAFFDRWKVPKRHHAESETHVS